MPVLDDLDEQKQDDLHNPAMNRARQLTKQENDAFSSITDNFDQTADDSQENTNIAKVKKQEDNPMNSSFGSNPKAQKQTFIAKVKQNKKKLGLIGIGGGGLAGILIAGVFAFMPLKLEMMIQNITGAAAQVPAHAVEQRTEYLITRALATRMMIAANGSGSLEAGKLAFCANGAIGCSLFLTYTSDYFEKKMGLSFKDMGDGTFKATTVDVHGRTRLGAKGQSWTINVDKGMTADGITKTTESITKSSNGEMRKWIQGTVKEDLKTSNTISRFLARRIMMKKYGVTHWRAFEKTQAKAADIKSSFKAGIFKNTIGKISPRTATYMACLSGGESCAKLLEHYSSNIDLEQIAKDNEANGGKDSTEYKAAARQQDSINKIQAGLSGEAPADGSKTLMSKFISSNVLKIAGGGLAAAGILDLALMAVHSVDNGNLEEIGYDMQKTAAIGYAFGDDTGIVPNNDKMKAGDVDIEALGTVMSMLDNSEASPLMAVENGTATTVASLSTASAASGQITRDCDTAEGIKPVTLQPGQTICPERQMVRDYTGSFTSNPSWKGVAALADAWAASGHKFFEVLNGAMSTVMNAIPGMKQAMAALGNLAAPTIEWLMSLIFDVPPMGFETTGANNYDSLSAGIRVSQNDLMQQGVGTDGKAFGGGGTVLSNDQIAMIQQDAKSSEQDNYNQQSVLAKVFSPSLKGSFAQNFIAMMPTSVSALARVPTMAFASLTSSSASAAAPMAVNPFNMPIYGYATNDPVLVADPTNYTPASCEASAKAREDSYGKHEESGWKVAVYSLADPCALEKIAVGSALESANVTDDEYSLPKLSSLASDSTSPSGPTQNSGNIKDNGWAWPSTKGSTACGFDCYPGHTGMDINVTSGNPFYAARDGVVKSAGVDPYMNQAICTGATGGLGGVIMNGPQYTIVINHQINGQSVDTVYTHITPGSILVKAGDVVKAGDMIAKTGASGCVTGPHAHFGIFTGGFPNGVAVDPTTILGRQG